MSQATKTALLAVLIYAAFNLLLPLIPLPAHRPPAALLFLIVVVPTAAFMLLQLWLALSLVNLRLRPALAGLAAVISISLWIVILFLIHPHFGLTHTANFALYLLRQFLLGLAVTFAATFLGITLSPIVREINVLLPVALVAMPIDYLGAMTPMGFTQNMVSQHPQFVQALSVAVPKIGGVRHGGLHPIGFIGPGDVLFLAFFFAIVLRLNLNVKGTFWIMYGLLTATLLIVILPGGINIAALIPMGLAVLIANWRYFKLKRDEVFATIYAGIVVIALASAFYAYSHVHFFHSRS